MKEIILRRSTDYVLDYVQKIKESQNATEH